MTSVNLYKQDGSQNGTIDLNADIFGIEPNENAAFLQVQPSSQGSSTCY